MTEDVASSLAPRDALAPRHRVLVLDDLSVATRERSAARSWSGLVTPMSPEATRLDACFHLAAIASVERSLLDWSAPPGEPTEPSRLLMRCAAREGEPVPVGSRPPPPSTARERHPCSKPTRRDRSPPTGSQSWLRAARPLAPDCTAFRPAAFACSRYGPLQNPSSRMRVGSQFREATRPRHADRHHGMAGRSASLCEEAARFPLLHDRAVCPRKISTSCQSSIAITIWPGCSPLRGHRLWCHQVRPALAPSHSDAILRRAFLYCRCAPN